MPAARKPLRVEDGFYSLGMLKTELKVSRRTIERAIKAGTMVPVAYTISGKPRFSEKQVEGFKCLARESRYRGSKYVMGHITSIGTPPPKPPKTPKLAKPRKRRVVQNASAWLRKTRLKHNPDMLRSLQEVEKFLDLDAMLDI